MAPKSRTNKKRGAIAKKKTKKEKKKRKEPTAMATVMKNAEFVSKLQDKLNKIALDRKLDDTCCASDSQISQFGSEPIAFIPESGPVRPDSSESEEPLEDTQTVNTCSEWVRTQDSMQKQNIDAMKKQKTTSCGFRALALLHNRMADLEVQFQRDVFNLECRYMTNLYKPLINVRETLLGFTKRSANVHVTEAYVQSLVKPCLTCSAFNSRHGDELTCNVRKFLYGANVLELLYPLVFLRDFSEKSKICLVFPDNPPLCSDFWLRILLHSEPPLRTIIESNDLPKLTYLRDVKVDLIAVRSDELQERAERRGLSAVGSAVGFDIRFKFSPNPYFRNNVLSKRYVIDLEADEADYSIVKMNQNECESVASWEADNEDTARSEECFPCKKVKLSHQPSTEKLLQYGGPQVIAIRGCKIDWFKDNLPSDRRASGNSCRETLPHSTSKFSKEQSFFQYFENSWDKGEDVSSSCIQRDYQIGTYIRDKLVPRAYALYRCSCSTSDCQLMSKQKEESSNKCTAAAERAAEGEPKCCDLKAKHASFQAERVTFEDERKVTKHEGPTVDKKDSEAAAIQAPPGQNVGVYNVADDVCSMQRKAGVCQTDEKRLPCETNDLPLPTRKDLFGCKPNLPPDFFPVNPVQIVQDNARPCAQRRLPKAEPPDYGCALQNCAVKNYGYDDIDDWDSPIFVNKTLEQKREEFERDCAFRNSYDDVDEAVVLPPDYDQVDEIVTIPPKATVLYSHHDKYNNNQVASTYQNTCTNCQECPGFCQQRPGASPESASYRRDTTSGNNSENANLLSRNICDSPFTMYDSVSASRQKMYECAQKVNTIMQEQKQQLEKQNLKKMEELQQQWEQRRQLNDRATRDYDARTSIGADLRNNPTNAAVNDTSLVPVESELSASFQQFSNSGQQADDELDFDEDRADVSGSSRQMPYNRIKYEAKAGARHRKRCREPFVPPSASTDDTDTMQSCLAQETSYPQKRIKYRPVRSQSDPDGSSDVASSSGGNTPDAMTDHRPFNVSTPQTSESDLGSPNPINEFQRLEDQHSVGPQCSSGPIGDSSDESDDKTRTRSLDATRCEGYDSEAPQTPTETPSSCSQQ